MEHTAAGIRLKKTKGVTSRTQIEGWAPRGRIIPELGGGWSTWRGKRAKSRRLTVLEGVGLLLEITCDLAKATPIPLHRHFEHSPNYTHPPKPQLWTSPKLHPSPYTATLNIAKATPVPLNHNSQTSPKLHPSPYTATLNTAKATPIPLNHTSETKATPIPLHRHFEHSQSYTHPPKPHLWISPKLHPSPYTATLNIAKATPIPLNHTPEYHQSYTHPPTPPLGTSPKLHPSPTPPLWT